MAIPFCDLKPQFLALKEEIYAGLEKVFEHGQFINGPEVYELEQRLAEFVGVSHALVCSNGTDALLIPLMALGIGPGDEVITTSFSFIATAEVICLVGARPVFVDIDPKTYNLDPAQVRKAITPRTKAIMPVSLYGQMADMDELLVIAEQYQLYLIEDAAQSFGATYKGKRSCSMGTAAGTSFFPAKPLGCYGDGGAIFTNRSDLYQAMREIREHGSLRRYYHTRLGLNARLDTIQCAILLAKLKRYPREIEMRQHLAQRYLQGLADVHVPGFCLPWVAPDRTSVWAQFTIQVSNREKFQKAMESRGIPTSVHYPMIMPEQPWYKANCPTDGRFPMAQQAAQNVVSLPFYADMSLSTQDEIIRAVKEVLLNNEIR